MLIYIYICSEPVHHYTRIEDVDAHWNLSWLPIVTREQSHRKVVGLLGHLDRSFEDIPQYINAPMMAFVLEGTVVATGGPF